MRLVMTYEDGNDMTYWTTTTLPIVYESPEAAYIDFIDMVEKTRIRYKEYDDFSRDLSNRSLPDFAEKINAFYKSGIVSGYFHWQGHEFNLNSFINNEYPKFETVDEWYRGLE